MPSNPNTRDDNVIRPSDAGAHPRGSTFEPSLACTQPPKTRGSPSPRHSHRQRRAGGVPPAQACDGGSAFLQTSRPLAHSRGV